MITIYVDGACSGNGKENSKGGFGVVIVDKDNDIVLKLIKNMICMLEVLEKDYPKNIKILRR